MGEALSQLLERVKNEPVLVTTLVGAVIALLVAFGVDIDDGQKAAVIGCVSAGLALFARSQVKPTRKGS